MAINTFLATRLMSPTPQDVFDLPDDPRSSLIQLHSRDAHMVDGAPSTMLPKVVQHINAEALRADAERACARCSEEEAREVLRDTDAPLSQALECCHYGVMPRRELARRVGVTEEAIRLRVLKARTRVEAWTGQPISDPVVRTAANVQALAAHWGGAE